MESWVINVAKKPKKRKCIMKKLLSITLFIISFQSLGQRKYEFILAPESLSSINSNVINDDPSFPKAAPVDTLGDGLPSNNKKHFILTDLQKKVKISKEIIFEIIDSITSSILNYSLDEYGGFLNDFTDKSGNKVSYFTSLKSDTIKTLFNPEEFIIKSILDSNRILVENPLKNSEIGIIDYEGRKLLNFSNWYSFERSLSKNIWIVKNANRKNRFCVFDIKNMVAILDFDQTIDYSLIEVANNPFKDENERLVDLGLVLIKNVKNGYFNFLTREGELLNKGRDFDIKSIEFIGKSLILNASESSYLISKSKNTYLFIDLNFAPIEMPYCHQTESSNEKYLLVYKAKTPIEKLFKENRHDYFVGLMDYSGKIIISPEYDSFIDIDSENVVLRKNNVDHLFDLTGKEFVSGNHIKLHGDKCFSLENNSSRTEGVYKINLGSSTKLNLIFDSSKKHKSVKIISYQGKFGLLNSENNEPILKLDYDEISSFHEWDEDVNIDEKLLLIRKNNLYGVYNFETNQFLIDINFSRIIIFRVDGKVHFLARSKQNGNKLYNFKELLLGSSTIIPLTLINRFDFDDENPSSTDFYTMNDYADLKAQPSLEYVKIKIKINGKWEFKFYNFIKNKMYSYMPISNQINEKWVVYGDRIFVNDLIVYRQRIKLSRKIIDSACDESSIDILPFQYDAKKFPLVDVNKYGLISKDFNIISKPIYDVIKQEGEFIICSRGLKNIFFDIFNTRGLLLFSGVKGIEQVDQESVREWPEYNITAGGLLLILTKFGNSLRWNYIDSDGKVIDFKSEDSLLPVIYVESQ